MGDLCDLCDHGDEVIDRVERGATVIITRAGVPVSDSGVDVDQGQRSLPEIDRRPFALDQRNALSRSARGTGSRRLEPVSEESFGGLIAAVAIANDLPLHTCNPDDFGHIPGLGVIPVEVPES